MSASSELINKLFQSRRRSSRGKPSKADNHILRSLLESNPHLTPGAVAEELAPTIRLQEGISNVLDLSRSIIIGKGKNGAVLETCGGEKWILYENIKGKQVYCNQIHNKIVINGSQIVLENLGRPTDPERDAKRSVAMRPYFCTIRDEIRLETKAFIKIRRAALKRLIESDYNRYVKELRKYDSAITRTQP